MSDLEAAGLGQHTGDAMWRVFDQLTLDENGCWLYTGSIRRPGSRKARRRTSRSSSAGGQP